MTRPRFGTSMFVNPIWLKSARARLRWKHVISWGTVTVSLTAFVFMIIYMNMTEQMGATAAAAAKAALPGIVVVQATILMVLGTGAVASGIAQERDDRLIDYQRLTPMSPTSKILGYLFGLPVREYFLFALTLPFLAVAVAISGFSLFTLAHFYVVFFTSVWVYHMTGLVAGMLSTRPRFASMLSMGFVLVLYFALPNLSRIGITYFEFLTIRPTFFGLLQQELPQGIGDSAPVLAGIDTFRDVPFFNLFLHPTVYTLLVQGFLLCVMFVVVHRKWRNQSNHALSKIQALAVYSGVLAFALASVWPIIADAGVRQQVFGALERRGPGMHPTESLLILLLVLFMIVGAAFFVVILGATPSRHTAIEGLRRAHKHGRRRVRLNSDAASSLPLTIVMLGLTFVALVTPLRLAQHSGMFFIDPPSLMSTLSFIVLLGAIALFMQGFRERCGLRVFLITIFLLWIVPWFAMTIMFSAQNAWIAGAYVGLPCPPVAVWIAIGTILESATPVPGRSPEYLIPELVQSRHALLTTSLVLYGALAAGMQFELWRWKRRAHSSVRLATPALTER
ncbi:MAG: hypothetical protein IH985_02800 [Planctomycetes bacterium]|nr:hypothetical protein [Planctomycetota bacterium]